MNNSLTRSADQPPRPLRHLSVYLATLVKGRLWLKVLIGMGLGLVVGTLLGPSVGDRKSTRLNSSHVRISYAVFCLKKKKKREVIIVAPHLQLNPHLGVEVLVALEHLATDEDVAARIPARDPG